jgi:AhpC/TSA family
MRFIRLSTLVALAGLWSNCGNDLGLPLQHTPTTDASVSIDSGASIDGGASLDGGGYPTVNIGGRPRTATQAGQIFPNLTLQGVRSAATMDTPTSVSISEYYDPTGARYDLLHVVGIFMWCPHCNNETSNLSKIAAWQTDHRVAVVQIAMEGYGSAAPVLADLQKWVGGYNLGFPVLIDGQGAELGQYFSVNYVPVNIVVNPRTMEILAVDIGEVGDCQAYEQGFLNNL